MKIMPTNKQFKGKVYYYANLNGQEKQIEREFEDADEFNKFVESHDELRLPSLTDRMPRMGMNDWLGFGSYFDNLLEDKFEDFFGLPAGKQASLPDVDVDLQKYEDELQKIKEKEAQKRQKKAELQHKKANLEAALNKLQSYKQLFEKEGNADKVKEVEQDIQKVKDELNNLDL